MTVPDVPNVKGHSARGARWVQVVGFLLVCGVTVGADQASKVFILSWFSDRAWAHADLLPFLRLVAVWNDGVGFGLFGGGALPSVVIGSLSGILALWFVWIGLRSRRLWVGTAAALVVGGAVGNIIDRVRFGAVFDFVDVHVETWSWPAFNVADSAIVVGVFWYVILEGWEPKPEGSK